MDLTHCDNFGIHINFSFFHKFFFVNHLLPVLLKALSEYPKLLGAMVLIFYLVVNFLLNMSTRLVLLLYLNVC